MYFLISSEAALEMSKSRRSIPEQRQDSMRGGNIKGVQYDSVLVR